jgi:hypothetical protein
MTLPEWRYSDAVCQSRQQNLLDPPSFEEITKAVKQTMRIQCGHPDPCVDKAEYQRIVYCVVVDRPLFDLFFNSVNGYRAWYFRSGAKGIDKNKLFLQSLTPALLEFRSNDQASNQMIERSLNASSAKAWLAEVGKEICPKCEGEWSAPHDDQAEILNGCWEHSTLHSGWGRKAPYLAKIRLFGAFVSEADDPYVASHKIDRAEQIRDCGWS